MRTLLWCLLVALLLSSLTACGWRLRGTSAVEIDAAVYVKYERASAELRRELSQVLQANKVTQVETGESADLVLVVHSDGQGRRVLSVDQVGVVNEYELQYQVSYSIRDGQGVELSPLQHISLQRDYSYDQGEVLAKDKEERLLFDFMRRAAVQKLMRQLQRVAQEQVNSAPASATDRPVDAN